MRFGFSIGETSPEVEDWQNSLNAVGYDVNVSGVYDATTSSATRRFKSAQGLPADDAVDDAALTAMVAKRDELEARVPGNLPTIDAEPMAIVGRAPSWLWWIGAGLVAVAGAYTIKQVAFGHGGRS